MWSPSNSQESQRYGVSPFQKVTIDIKTQDWSKGQLFPQFEGESLYVEQCDYPVAISLINPSGGNIRQTFLLRNGMHIRGSFKGLIFYHPALTFPAGSGPCEVRLVLGKDAPDNYNNQDSDPTWGRSASILDTVLGAGTSYVKSIFVPAGAKLIKDLRISFYATTVTVAYWDSISRIDAAALAGIAPTVVEKGVTFNTPNAMSGMFKLSNPVTGAGGQWIAEDSDIPIPSDCSYIRAFIQGTGITIAGAGCATKASFR